MKLFRDRYLKTILTAGTIIVGAMYTIHRFDVVRRNVGPGRFSHASGNTVSSPSPSNYPSPGPFLIKYVYDGDTIELNNGEKVRLIGIDAPEIHHRELPVQRFGEEARDFLKKLAEGQECTLEFEPPNFRDVFGRLLAYVYVGGMLVNAELIRRGYAYSYTRFPFDKEAEFVNLERMARHNQYGLWNLSLRDGRIANLTNRYERLNTEGRAKLDDILNELNKNYPMEGQIEKQEQNNTKTK